MSRQSESELFAQLAEKLLQGEIICEFTAESLYEYLKDPYHQEELDGYLRRIGRVLRQSQDGSVFFAGYRDLKNSEIQRQIRSQFAVTLNSLEPLVRWLKLALSADNTGRPLQPGELLRGSELLSAIEHARSLVEELDRLANTRLFKTQATGPKKQLDAILGKLQELGYLISSGSSGSVYIATGKWARLYEVLQFIATHEQLDAEEDVPEQGELVH